MVSTSSIIMQSLWKIVLRAPAVGAKMWRFFLSRTDPTGCAFEGEHSSNDHCVAVYGSILICFSIFLQKESPFQTHYTHTRNCGQKLRKVQKSAEKFVRTTSYRCSLFCIVYLLRLCLYVERNSKWEVLFCMQFITYVPVCIMSVADSSDDKINADL